MSEIVTTPNIASPDDLYARLLDLHHGLNAEQSALANAKLILLLANHIGDAEVVLEAIRLAAPAACRKG